MRRAIFAGLAVALAAAPVAADDARERVGSARARLGERADDNDYLGRLATAVRTRLDAAIASHAPKLVPPVPFKPRWKATRIGWLDVGGPVVAATAADLDGDGKAELYLVTPREVVAVSLAGKVKELGRVAFHGEPAVPASRDVVGMAVVQGGALIAAVSSYAKDMRIEWKSRALVGKHGPGGFPICGEHVALSPGKNYFGDGANATFATLCRDDLVDAQGYPLHVRGELATTGVLSVTVEKCAPGGTTCQPFGSYEYKDVGVAFDLADVDRDGTPELITSSASLPGDTDTLRVITLGAPASKPLFHSKNFNQGFAGIAVADVDGDGTPEVIAVVRFAGMPKCELWRFD